MPGDWSASLPFYLVLAGGNREQIQAGLAQLADHYAVELYLVDFASHVVIPN